MKKCMISAIAGFAIGMYLGYSREDEIEDICRQSKKAKKKMKKKYHKAMDQVMDYMDMD